MKTNATQFRSGLLTSAASILITTLLSNRPRLLLACALLVSSSAPLRAQISFVDIFRTGLFDQTGNGAGGIAYDSSYVGIDLFSETANQYSTVRVFYPGPASPVLLVNDNPNNASDYEFTSNTFSSQAALDTAYPKGTYSFTANGGGPAATTMISYANDAYSVTQPFLAGTTFSNLQGTNPAANFTFRLSPFTPNAATTNAFIFLNVFDAATGNVVFTANFLDPSTSSVVLPANTLHSNTAYVFDLDYSDRVQVASPGADFDAQLGFDLRTEGNFITGVPEPAVSAFVIVGIAALLFSRKRSKTRA